MQKVLQQVSSSTGLHCSQHLHITGIGGEHDESCFRKISENRDHCVDSTQLWHLQIHQGDIRTMCAKLLDSLTTIRCFSHDHHIGLVGNDRDNALQENRVIINCHDSNFILFNTHGRTLL